MFEGRLSWCPLFVSRKWKVGYESGVEYQRKMKEERCVKALVYLNRWRRLMVEYCIRLVLHEWHVCVGGESLGLTC